MEDFFDIGYQLKPATEQRPGEWPYEYFYFGVFDGHGGCEAACFARQSLLKMIVRQADFWSDNDEDVMRAIRQGFADTHSAMRELLSTWERTNKTLPSTAGTTAAVLFIKNGKFYSAHVGDSRIVISRKHPETKQWIVNQRTADHKPELKEETERIERAGGEVKSKFGVHRVVWRRPIWSKEFDAKLNAEQKSEDYDDLIKQIETYPIDESLVENYQIIPFLAIARSLGDFWSINPESGQFIVSPEPDVSCRPIDENDTCILLATDGLWNVMNSWQAARFLQELKVVKDGERNSRDHASEYFSTDNYYDVSMPKNDKNHALSLVYIAYQIWERRRLRSDNITAVVAMFSDILHPAQAKSSAPSKNLRTKSTIDNIKQLGQTHIFCEHITSDAEPIFYANPGSESEAKMWQTIEEYLVFPPTVFCSTKAHITPPENYNRLSSAKCRRLVHGLGEDMHIYIKNVSDDPADNEEEKWYINHKLKMVRNSSCQATQPIHDFGQPWHQMDDNNDVDDDDDEYFSHEHYFISEDDLKVGDVVRESYNSYITVDQAFLDEIRKKKSVKRRRYDTDSNISIY